MIPAITLIGMSGVGKTTLARKLEADDCTVFSADDNIANRLVEEEKLPQESRQKNRYAEPTDLLANYIGKFGGVRFGGLERATFLARQQDYREAELDDLLTFATQSPSQGVVYDTTGSFCEVIDCANLEADTAYQRIKACSCIVYLACNEQEEELLLQRQLERPKPMLYNRAFFETQVALFRQAHNNRAEADIVPDEFLRHIFRAVFHHRRTRYEALAHVTLTSADLDGVLSAQAFLDLVQEKRHTASNRA